MSNFLLDLGLAFALIVIVTLLTGPILYGIGWIIDMIGYEVLEVIKHTKQRKDAIERYKNNKEN